MLALIEAFFAIVLRRRGPEDLPDSGFLLALTLGAYVAVQALLATAFYGWSGRALQALLLDVALLAGCYWLLLRLAGRPARFRRTLTALAGTGAVLALPQAPLVWFSGIAAAGGDAAVGPKLLLLLLLVWTIVVQAHITSRALSATFWVGLAVALGYFILSYEVSGQLIPAAG